MNRGKLLGILVAATIMIMVTAVVSWAESLRTPEWRVVLEAYASPAEIDQVKRANKPWNFTDKLEHLVVDIGQFEYIADITYDGPHTYSIMFPYPPKVVHCALIKNNQGQKIVFVNYHSDNLWQSGWVVSESRRDLSHKEIVDLLASVGCVLDL